MSVPAHPLQLPLFVLDKRCRVCGVLLPITSFSRHGETKDGYRSYCKACRSAAYFANREQERAAQRSYYLRHQEHIKKQAAVWYEANRDRANLRKSARHYERRDEVLAQGRARRLANPEYYRAQGRASYYRYAEARRARSRAYNASHREERAAYARAVRQRNPAPFIARSQAYRARRARAEGTYTAADIMDLWYAQDDLCFYCEKQLHGRYHVEHRQPLRRGGSNWPANLALSCAHCNHSKRDKTEEEFRAYLAALRRPHTPAQL